jgi:hypothetical protein
MSEWLTTGEMIDRLKVGEVAEAVSGMVKGWKVEKLPADENFGERIVWRDVLGVDRNVIQLNENVINAKWRILPKYVSFEEAMKAYAEGKNIVFYPASNEECNPVRLPQCYRNYVLEDLRLGEFSLLELVNGKWSIEE